MRSSTSTATGDLQDIYKYIRERGGSPAVARSYILRLQESCDGIGHMPEAGRRRDDLLPGLRTWSFERRAVIAYMLTGGVVAIGNIFYAGRDLASFYSRGRHLKLVP